MLSESSEHSCGLRASEKPAAEILVCLCTLASCRVHLAHARPTCKYLSRNGGATVHFAAMHRFLIVLAAAEAFSPPRTALSYEQQSATSASVAFGRGGAIAAATRDGGSLAAASRDELIGEATGTAILLTFGYGAVATSSIDGALTLPGVAAVWGLGVALGVLASNDLSGAHLNPAVTAALAATNKFPVKKVAPYVCLLYTSPSPRDVEESRMPSSA